MNGLSGYTPPSPAFDEIAVHAHHWLIAKQDGPASEGVCKTCGERRDFVNGFRRSYTAGAHFRRALAPAAAPPPDLVP